jgi:hypothetical protein
MINHVKQIHRLIGGYKWRKKLKLVQIAISTLRSFCGGDGNE